MVRKHLGIKDSISYLIQGKYYYSRPTEVVLDSANSDQITVGR